MKLHIFIIIFLFYQYEQGQAAIPSSFDSSHNKKPASPSSIEKSHVPRPKKRAKQELSAALPSQILPVPFIKPIDKDVDLGFVPIPTPSSIPSSFDVLIDIASAPDAEETDPLEISSKKRGEDSGEISHIEKKTETTSQLMSNL